MRGIFPNSSATRLFLYPSKFAKELLTRDTPAFFATLRRSGSESRSQVSL